MEMELPRIGPDSEGGTSNREDQNVELQTLMSDESLNQEEDDLQEVVTRLNQEETDIFSIQSESFCEVDTGDPILDAIYNAVVRNDVSEIAELLNLSCDLQDRVSKWQSGVDSRYPFLWEHLEKEVSVLKSEKRPQLIEPHVNMTVPVCNARMEMLEGNWTLLHLASSFAHHSIVYLLLLAGADASARDSFSRTALDVTGSNLYEETPQHIIVPGVWDVTDELNRVDDRSIVIRIFLQLGVTFDFTTTNDDATIYTLLLTEIYSLGRKDLRLVKNLLDAGALRDEYMAWRAIQVFVEKRADKELKLILSNSSTSKYVNLTLCAAVKVGWIDGVRLALLSGASILEEETMPYGCFNALVVAVIYYKHSDILKLLLMVAKHQLSEDEDYSELRSSFPRAPTLLRSRISYFETLRHYSESFTDIINLKYDSQTTLISYAAQYNNLECFKILLENNGSLVCNELIFAAENNSIEIAELIIQHDGSTIHATDWNGRQPLHIACGSRNRRDMIELLLQNGADLSRKDKSGITPIDIITYNFTNPTEFMEEVFDSYITCNQDEDNNRKYNIDYKILIADNVDARNLDVIEALVNADQAELLSHPLIESFLYLKWKSLEIFFYIAWTIHVFFVLALNLLIVPLYYFRDKNEELPKYYFDFTFWIFIIFITITIFIEQGILRITSYRDLLQWETGLKLITIIISVCLPFVLSSESTGSEMIRIFATLAVILSSLELTVLASRFTSWGYHMLMFERVAYKVAKILLIFSFPIIGFSLGFMIQFRSEEPFGDPVAAFVKTFVMMTSEFDYSATFNTTRLSEQDAFILAPRIIFLCFIILLSIVLMNLMVGIAVNDVNDLEKKGNIRRLQKQVEFLASLEKSYFAKYFKVHSKKTFTHRNVFLCYNEIRGRFKYNSILPAHVRESIIKKLRIRNIMVEKIFMDKDYRRKIDEMHAALEIYNLKFDRLEQGLLKLLDRN